MFWKRGFTATSLDDLLSVMSLSKSSFYAEFRSKEDLYRVCLRHYQDTIVEYLSQLRADSASTCNFFTAIFGEAVEDGAAGDPKGCFIVNSAIEFGQHDSRFSDDVRSALTEVQNAFEAAIRQGVQSGELATTPSPKVMAKYLLTCLSGVRAMVKGGMPVTDARAVVRKVLDSLVEDS
ncbi:MAG: TetR/AcrR family transcriptional regulator [Planctomycetaceae bacterium]